MADSATNVTFTDAPDDDVFAVDGDTGPFTGAFGARPSAQFDDRACFVVVKVLAKMGPKSADL